MHRFSRLSVAFALVVSAVACSWRTERKASETPYLERRATFQTHLIHVGPSPQPFTNDPPPPGVEEVVYSSRGMRLKAWVAFPPEATRDHPVPGVVYFHGGFAFGADDFEDVRPFLDAGMAVMTPSLRGENGNPGTHELYFAEVDDAKGAVSWLRRQDRIDAKHLYTFGHSAGGILSALLSLQEVPLRYGGSAGGLYGTDLFDIVKDVPFDKNLPGERELRVLVGNARWMKRAHYAYCGTEDRWQAVQAAREEAKTQPLLHIAMVPGNHFQSLARAVQAFVKQIQAEP